MNKQGKDSNNRCCEGFRTSSGKCSNSCSTKFRVCLKHYQATIDPNHECTFGEEITPVLGSNSIQSSRDEPIEFALDFKWPGTFSLIIEAWHQSNKTSGRTLFFWNIILNFLRQIICFVNPRAREIIWVDQRNLFFTNWYEGESWILTLKSLFSFPFFFVNKYF